MFITTYYILMAGCFSFHGVQQCARDKWGGMTRIHYALKQGTVVLAALK